MSVIHFILSLHQLTTIKDDKTAVDAYLAKVGAQSALPKIIKAGYQVLNLQHFFTVGKVCVCVSV